MSQFGGSSQDDYGFFAPTRVSGGAASQFGPAAAPSGAPALGSTGGFGAGAPYAAPATGRSSTSPKAKALVTLLVVAVLAVGGWFGWNAYRLGRPLVVPGTLSAMSPVSTKQVAAVKTQVQQQWQSQYPDQQLQIEVYAGHKQAAILAMARGKSDIEGDFADIGYTGELQPVGHSTCATLPESVVACERASRTLSALVVFFNGTAHEAASALDEAWALQ